MELIKSKLNGVQIIKPYIYEDFRGEFVESYNRETFKKLGINLDFIQDDFSISSKHVLRGIHGDSLTWKLVSCVLGQIYLVVICCDEKSPQFGQWESFSISEKNRMMVLVPPTFGLAHLVLTDRAIFHYKQTTNYDRSSQFTFRHDDPRFKIWWPVKNPFLSKRDSEA